MARAEKIRLELQVQLNQAKQLRTELENERSAISVQAGELNSFQEPIQTIEGEFDQATTNHELQPTASIESRDSESGFMSRSDKSLGEKGTGGSIVNVASRAAFRGDSPDHWSYAASKGAIISLTKTLARAYSAEGIYTYAVAPGIVLTDMALAEFERDPTLRDRVVSEIPYGDIAPASELANAICFLASGLATHATGQTIDINGASYVR